jgi:hypothetical protein
MVPLLDFALGCCNPNAVYEFGNLPRPTILDRFPVCPVRRVIVAKQAIFVRTDIAEKQVTMLESV